MSASNSTFRSHLFSFSETVIETHKNLMTCVIFGNKKPVCVSNDQISIEAQIVCIKPDILHQVIIPTGGAEILFLDGLQRATLQENFEGLDLNWHHVPDAFNDANVALLTEFRNFLDDRTAPPDPDIMEIVNEIYSSPFNRMSQHELANQLGLERTQSLRHFKVVTGQTFRKFKTWAASVEVVHSAYQGQQIGLAGMDAGFADAAHTTRTSNEIFGMTPTLGLNKLLNVTTLI